MAASSYLNPAPVTRRVRGYFAPVNRGLAAPAVFNPAEMGRFSLDSPPAPWVSLGWIKNFVRKAGSRTAPVLTGIPAAVLEQTRETLDAQLGLQFLNWTKLTMALATGSQHMNLLAPASGAAAVPAVTIQSGATATALPMVASDAAKFTAGQIVAVDVDYTGQTGFVGSPVSGAYVRTPLTDVDYVRRVTFNVALISAVSATGLTLAEALPGGAPVAGMKAQAALGFVDREGGSFFQEWSGLFVMEGAQGERIFFYYPRLQSLGSAAEVGSLLAGKQGSTLERVLLSGEFRALPVTDGLDGERVVCYRSFLPAALAQV
jgi:hypothetical protein